MKGMIYMTMRNLLNSGDFVMLIPIGVHITLQYNTSGNLEKIYTGYDSTRIDRTEDMMGLFLENNIVPVKMHITRGTSWVRGVLYTGQLCLSQGVIPDVVEAELISKFIKSPNKFNFFAGTIESTSTVFRGMTAIRQGLAMSKFKILPGWFVPFGVSEKTINDWLNSPQYTFMPIVTDLIIYHKDNINIISTKLTQLVVNEITKYTDYNGYVKAKISIKNSSQVMHINYSDIVRFNIHNGSIIVLDVEKQIIFSKNITKSKKYSNIITCAHCGRHYEIPENGTVLCPDIHCSSRLLQNIIQFIDVLKLPKYDDEIIFNWIKTNKVTCIPDLLLIDEYKSIEIKISITDLLRALVPISLIPHEDVFMSFVIACSNNERTFKYYIHNPNHIVSDLGFSHVDLNKLIAWLSDGYNVSDLNTLLESSQISFLSIKKKFEGAPIFRNKTIYITGNFVRGTIGEIAAILQSYSATVTTQFTNTVDCVLTGGTQENIDGKSIRAANILNKPIISEDIFFKQYDIDTDLRMIR